jgi:hypothetical protein
MVISHSLQSVILNIYLPKEFEKSSVKKKSTLLTNNWKVKEQFSPYCSSTVFNMQFTLNLNWKVIPSPNLPSTHSPIKSLSSFLLKSWEIIVGRFFYRLWAQTLVHQRKWLWNILAMLGSCHTVIQLPCDHLQKQETQSFQVSDADW